MNHGDDDPGVQQCERDRPAPQRTGPRLATARPTARRRRRLTATARHTAVAATESRTSTCGSRTPITDPALVRMR